MRRELVERTEAAYDQGNLAFLRRMAGTDTGNATELRRAMLDRIEDAYGRNDLPLLKRMTIEERGRALVDLARHRAKRYREGKPNEPLNLNPWFLDPPRSATPAGPENQMPTGIASASDGRRRRDCARNSDCAAGSFCSQDGKCERRQRQRPTRPDPPPIQPGVIPLVIPGTGNACNEPNTGNPATCEELRQETRFNEIEAHNFGCTAIYDPRTQQTVYSGNPRCQELLDVIDEHGSSSTAAAVRLRPAGRAPSRQEHNTPLLKPVRAAFGAPPRRTAAPPARDRLAPLRCSRSRSSDPATAPPASTRPGDAGSRRPLDHGPPDRPRRAPEQQPLFDARRLPPGIYRLHRRRTDVEHRSAPVLIGLRAPHCWHRSESEPPNVWKVSHLGRVECTGIFSRRSPLSQ